VLAGSLHFDTPACRAVHAEGSAMLLMYGTKNSRLRPKGCWSHAFTCQVGLVHIYIPGLPVWPFCTAGLCPDAQGDCGTAEQHGEAGFLCSIVWCTCPGWGAVTPKSEGAAAAEAEATAVFVKPQPSTVCALGAADNRPHILDPDFASCVFLLGGPCPGTCFGM
jgi:hypothetical protein